MATGADTMLVSLISEVRSIIYYALTAGAACGGGWYALSGTWKWYENAQWRGDATQKEIGADLLVASILLSITGFLSAGGGEAFSPTTSGYAVTLATSGLTPEAETAANSLLRAIFSLLTSIGWCAQVRGVLAVRELGKGKSETSVWRVLGYFIGGSILADFPNAALQLDQTLGTGLFV